jgi:hypothetical protein
MDQKPTRDDVQRIMKEVDDLASLNETAQRSKAAAKDKVENAEAKLKIAQKAASDAASVLRDAQAEQGRFDGLAAKSDRDLVAAREQLAKAISEAYGIGDKKAG